MHGLLGLLAFACYIIIAATECSTSKYREGPRDWLRCSNASIEEVKSKLQWNLMKIAISESMISEIPDRSFAVNSTTLEMLNFHSCGIHRIGNEAFLGLGSLKELSLSYNKITQLSAAWLSHLTSLERLDLSFNMITYIDPQSYLNLWNLQRLDINDNQLKQIPMLNFERMQRLKIIRIQENPLTYLNRAKLTLWLNDHKVNYATRDDDFIWFDSVLHSCLIDLPQTGELDRKMNTCVTMNMFEQLTSILATSPSIRDSTQVCYGQTRNLIDCFKKINIRTNGNILLNLLSTINDVAKIGTA
ncbi:leucine-rich repeat-containing protein 15 [Neodiprion pinetum]|uniref:Leucine-rich repeat-containing protein 15 n=1 Tax=Neodiprion lecontei TaxID=441921 RepID=A0A6J0CEZ9_NEOLC|nr:leucine-rich repeat-containing protein 15 [Neodiprion lecontei]XP_046418920.1 leucine-rich repeat-containing protein 15-like [Neodiprion fabricii]XP_046474953.1 leucine-rich repeat-containing protein 15-like [Neodiprion pinetum]XP_046612604.1 leucine-rich repeat-containing protein 15-like [Neodiprion virginianus]